MNKGLLYITFLFALIIQVQAYPSFVSDSSFNHTEVKELVYSFPEESYEFVNFIIFEELNPESSFYGIAHAQWNSAHDCYNGWIVIRVLDRKILKHELTHILDFCINRVDYSTEEFADSFDLEAYYDQNK